MKKLSLILLSFLSMTTYSVAHAFDRAGAITVAVGEGYDYFSSKRHINNTHAPFAALGYDFTDHWAIETLVGDVSTRSKRPQDDHRHVRGTIFALDGVYNFSPFHMLEPFVFIGPGAVGLNPNGGDANNEGSINGGFGAKFFFNQMIGLRVEARDFYTFVGGKNDIYLDGGLNFTFC